MLCDFASHEFGATPRRLVVEANRRAGKYPVALAIIDREMVPEDFGHTVGAARMERRQLGLGLLADFTEHLRAGSLKKLGLGRMLADGFQHAQNSQAGPVRCKRRLVPGNGNKTLRRQVINLVRLDFLDSLIQRTLVRKVTFGEA